MDTGLEVNTEKTKYMFVPLYQNAGQNCSLLTANKSSENVETIVANRNCVHNEIRSR
jgi:hypothetical protein